MPNRPPRYAGMYYYSIRNDPEYRFFVWRVNEGTERIVIIVGNHDIVGGLVYGPKRQVKREQKQFSTIWRPHVTGAHFSWYDGEWRENLIVQSYALALSVTEETLENAYQRLGGRRIP